VDASAARHVPVGARDRLGTVVPQRLTEHSGQSRLADRRYAVGGSYHLDASASASDDLSDSGDQSELDVGRCFVWNT
jgi:hypothetical protein